MSPIPVREALKSLEEYRLVESLTGWGYRVVNFNLESWMGFWQVREALECHAARLCAQRAKDFNILELKGLASIADKHLSKLNEFDKREKAEKDFHIRVAEISGYPELIPMSSLAIARLQPLTLLCSVRN